MWVWVGVGVGVGGWVGGSVWVSGWVHVCQCVGVGGVWVGVCIYVCLNCGWGYRWVVGLSSSFVFVKIHACTRLKMCIGLHVHARISKCASGCMYMHVPEIVLHARASKCALGCMYMHVPQNVHHFALILLKSNVLERDVTTFVFYRGHQKVGNHRCGKDVSCSNVQGWPEPHIYGVYSVFLAGE